MEALIAIPLFILLSMGLGILIGKMIDLGDSQD